MIFSNPVGNLPGLVPEAGSTEPRGGYFDYCVGSCLTKRSLQLENLFSDRAFRSEPGSRSDFGRGGKSGLRMAAGSGVHLGECRRRGDPTESATENIPPRFPRGKGEKAGQEPTVPGGDIGMHGKPPAEQDQVREKSRTDRIRSGARRPVSFDSRVGRSDKWLPLLPSAGKTEFGLSAHSAICFDRSMGRR